MNLLKQEENYLLETREYQFFYYSAEPTRGIIAWNNGCRLKVTLIPLVNFIDTDDDIGRIVSVDVQADDDVMLLELSVSSFACGTKIARWKFGEDTIEHSCRVVKENFFRLNEIVFFPREPAQGISTECNFAQLFSPALNRQGINYFSPENVAENPINASQFRDGTGLFTPSPDFYSLIMKNGSCIGAGILCRLGEYNYSNFIYDGTPNGFSLRLVYDGATENHETWDSPSLVLTQGNDEFKTLEEYCSTVYERGGAKHRQRRIPRWWNGPIFCGWGEQCSEAMRKAHSLEDHQDNTEIARQASHQRNYEEWLKILIKNGIKPRIVIIDDAWSEKPGSPIPHPERWANLRTFIKDCHDQNIRVLLWWNCFETEMVPPEACIRTSDNDIFRGAYGAMCADPTHPLFIEKFKEIIYKMLSLDDGCLNADGLKVDINGSIPAGQGYQIRGNVWGRELMKAMMSLIYDNAPLAKPDALIESHTAHPYFNDSLDMLRLNDMIFPDADIVEGMLFREKVARAASRDWLIDTDDWPLADIKQFRSYTEAQPRLGVPALYYAHSIGKIPTTFTQDEYTLIRDTWNSYNETIEQ